MPKPAKATQQIYDILVARRVIGQHYNVVCSAIEARAEVLNLNRKKEKGSLDDKDEALVAALEIAYGVKDLSALARFAYANWTAGPNCNLADNTQ